VTTVEFRGDLWRQKTRVPDLSSGVVCMILHLTVLLEHRLVTDTDRQTQTDTGPWLVPRGKKTLCTSPDNVEKSSFARTDKSVEDVNAML